MKAAYESYNPQALSILRKLSEEVVANRVRTDDDFNKFINEEQNKELTRALLNSRVIEELEEAGSKKKWYMLRRGTCLSENGSDIQIMQGSSLSVTAFRQFICWHDSQFQDSHAPIASASASSPSEMHGDEPPEHVVTADNQFGNFVFTSPADFQKFFTEINKKNGFGIALNSPSATPSYTLQTSGDSTTGFTASFMPKSPSHASRERTPTIICHEKKFTISGFETKIIKSGENNLPLNGNLLALFVSLKALRKQLASDDPEFVLQFALTGIHIDMEETELDIYKKEVFGTEYDQLKDCIKVVGANKAQASGSFANHSLQPTAKSTEAILAWFEKNKDSRSIAPASIKAWSDKIAEATDKKHLASITRLALLQIRQYKDDPNVRQKWSGVVVACLDASRGDQIAYESVKQEIKAKSTNSKTEFGATIALSFARDYAKASAEDCTNLVSDLDENCLRQLIEDFSRQNDMENLYKLCATDVPLTLLSQNLTSRIVQHCIRQNKVLPQDLLEKITDRNQLRTITELALDGLPATNDTFIAVFSRALAEGVTFESFESTRRHAPFARKLSFYTRLATASNFDLRGLDFSLGSGPTVKCELIKAAARAGDNEVNAVCVTLVATVTELTRCVTELMVHTLHPTAANRLAFAEHGLLAKMSQENDLTITPAQVDAIKFMVQQISSHSVNPMPDPVSVAALTKIIIRSEISHDDKREMLRQIAGLTAAQRGEPLDEDTIDVVATNLSQLGDLSPARNSIPRFTYLLPLLSSCAEIAKNGADAQKIKSMEFIIATCNALMNYEERAALQARRTSSDRPNKVKAIVTNLLTLFKEPNTAEKYQEVYHSVSDTVASPGENSALRDRVTRAIDNDRLRPQ